jgi:hypothetical protein
VPTVLTAQLSSFAMLHIVDSGEFVGKEMPISRIVVAVPNATVVLLD